MPCRGWQTCSRNPMFFKKKILLPPDMCTDRPVAVCGREVKGRESNTPGLFFFSFEKHRGRWQLRSAALTCFGGQIRSLRYIWLWLQVKNNCGWGGGGIVLLPQALRALGTASLKHYQRTLERSSSGRNHVKSHATLSRVKQQRWKL